MLCDNSVWVSAANTPPSIGSPGEDVCDVAQMPSSRTDLGCGTWTSKAPLAVVPRHGKGSLSTTVKTLAPDGFYHCPAYSLSWGDGTTENYPQRFCDDTTRMDTRTHTYTSPGSYTISYQRTSHQYPYTTSNSANVRVDAAGTASIQNQSPNQSQLANALTALESALKAILKLLGQ